MAETAESRVASRMIRRVEDLEDQFAKHAQDMAELRDSSLRTERSLARFLAGLSGLISSVPAAKIGAGDASARGGRRRSELTQNDRTQNDRDL